MKNILIEFKDVTTSKITIAKDEIRIKISTQIDEQKQNKHKTFLLSVAELFSDIELNNSVRMSVNETLSCLKLHCKENSKFILGAKTISLDVIELKQLTKKLKGEN